MMMLIGIGLNIEAELPSVNDIPFGCEELTLETLRELGGDCAKVTLYQWNRFINSGYKFLRGKEGMYLVTPNGVTEISIANPRSC